MILLLENKEIRQKNNTAAFNDKIIHNILGDEKCNKILSNFLQNESELDAYDTIIIHESIYSEDKRDELFKKLENFCKQTNKKIIKFSGNNTQAYLKDNLLEISSKSLYENLMVFVEEYAKNHANILMLAYGKNWYLNILLNILEKVNLLIEDSKEDDFDFDEFEDDFDLLKIQKILGDTKYQQLFADIDIDYEISLEQIKLFRNNLKSLIQEETDA
jgi:hypothetical protein